MSQLSFRGRPSTKSHSYTVRLSLRDIAVGEKAKLYGFQRPDSNIINVFRYREDRGHR